MKEKEILAKVIQDYNNISDHFNNTRVYNWVEFNLFKKYISDYVLLKEDGYKLKILDIGCGNGRLVNFLDLLEIDYEYLGIDNSIEQIKNANNNIGIKDNNKVRKNKIEFQVGDILNLSNYKKNEFDFIFCIAVFHHLPSKDTRYMALKEMKLVMKDDGLLFMTSWNLFQINYIKYIFDVNKYKNINPKSSKDLRDNKFSLLEKFNFKFKLKDTFIPYKNNSGEILSKRYYYAFDKTELRNLFLKSDYTILENKLSDDKNILEAKNIISILKK